MMGNDTLRRALLAAAAASLPLVISGCLGTDAGDNSDPVAQAGVDQTVRTGSDVVLSGRDSDDPDGAVLDHTWRQVGGPDVELIPVTTSTVRFRVPRLLQETQFEFDLTVTDNRRATTTDRVVITGIPADDPNRFLHFFDQADRFTVVAGLNSGSPLQADTAFNVALEATVTFPGVRVSAPGQPLPPGISLSADGRFVRTLSLPGGSGTWRAGFSPTPQDCDDPASPNLVFDVPAIDVDDLERDIENQIQVNEGRRDEIDYELTVTLSSPAAVDTYLCVRKGEPGDPTLAVVAEGNGGPGADSALSVDRNDLLDENQRTARAYYETIDPNGEKTTLADWLRATGFDTDPGVEAQYINGFDLGFGRQMFVRTDPVTGEVFSFVVNYPNLDAQIAGINPIATVAMEYTPAPSGGPPRTTFYTFVRDPETGDERRVLSMDFDGRGDKFVPGVCAVCHTGDPAVESDLMADASLPGGLRYPDEGDIGSGFLPWDVNTLFFSDAQFDRRSQSAAPALPGLGLAGQQAAFKAMNEAVLLTDPSDAVRELVEGWYGGPGLPSDVHQGDFVATGWAGNEALYTEVIGPNCRACHSAQKEADSNIIDLAEFEDLDDNRDRTRELVFEEGVMPFARLTMDNFWTIGEPTAAELLAEELGVDLAAIAGPVPGQPRGELAVAAGAFGGETRTGNTVAVRVAGADFLDTIQWTLETPAGSNAVLAGADTRRAAFVPDVVGDYTLALELANDAATRTESLVISAAQPPNLVVLAGDSLDVDVLGGAGSTVSIDAGPANGTAVPGAGTVLYTPQPFVSNDPNPFTPFFVGVDSFTYTSTEGSDSVTEALDVTVDPVEPFAALYADVLGVGNCTACHSGPAPDGGLQLGDGAATAFNEIRNTPGLLDLVIPEDSDILREPANQVPHGGNTRAGFGLNGDFSGFNRVLRWIQEGALNN